MNTNAVAKNYAQLTPEERFRLILAASGRGDDVERDRLARTAQRITLSMPDHSSHAHAFRELAMLTYIELLHDAHCYAVTFVARGDRSEGKEAKKRPQRKTAKTARLKKSDWTGLDLTLAYGYVLRTKLAGWKLFCERLNIPPLLVWQALPGFDWLLDTMALTEGTESLPGAAFVAEGFLRWLNAHRPAEHPEMTQVPLTAEGIASANQAILNERVKWWGG